MAITKSFYSDAQSDGVQIHRSKHLTPSVGSATLGMFRIPRFALIMDVWVNVLTAFNGTAPATLTLGFLGNGETEDDDGIMDAAQVALSTAGIKRATSDAQPWSEGKYLNASAASIVGTFTVNDSTAGSAYVFLTYCIIC